MRRSPPGSTLFPYTTLFRSSREAELDVLATAKERRDGLPQRLPRVRRAEVVAARRALLEGVEVRQPRSEDTRLNSSHSSISYAVFCLKKKIKTENCDIAHSH